MVEDISKTFLTRDYSKYVQFEYLSKCVRSKHWNNDTYYTDIDVEGIMRLSSWITADIL